jgi:hypothetical protein
MIEAGATAPQLVCPSVEGITALAPPTALKEIAFAGAIVDAALSEDTGRMVVVASELADIALKDEEQLRTKRALRLLGGILDYAATYANGSSGQDQIAQAKAHDQRTKVLESLTADMTDRTGREGDDVFSLGGALRLAGGLRLGTTTNASTFYGPLSVPLGIAYTHVARKDTACSCGIHIELDAIDLGNYLAVDNGPRVKSPDLGDAFAPSLSMGIAFGPSLPLVVAPTVSYTPQFVIDPNAPEKHGSVNVGITLGVHVPLIDLN